MDLTSDNVSCGSSLRENVGEYDLLARRRVVTRIPYINKTLFLLGRPFLEFRENRARSTRALFLHTLGHFRSSGGRTLNVCLRRLSGQNRSGSGHRRAEDRRAAGRDRDRGPGAWRSHRYSSFLIQHLARQPAPASSRRAPGISSATRSRRA